MSTRKGRASKVSHTEAERSFTSEPPLDGVLTSWPFPLSFSKFSIGSQRELVHLSSTTGGSIPTSPFDFQQAISQIPSPSSTLTYALVFSSIRNTHCGSFIFPLSSRPNEFVNPSSRPYLLQSYETQQAKEKEFVISVRLRTFGIQFECRHEKVIMNKNARWFMKKGWNEGKSMTILRTRRKRIRARFAFYKDKTRKPIKQWEDHKKESTFHLRSNQVILRLIWKRCNLHLSWPFVSLPYGWLLLSNHERSLSF